MTDLLYRYWRERLPVRIFVPVALFLAAWSLAVSASPDMARFSAAAALAYLLVFQFRLWDDLHDRDRDRREHPGRVLPSSDSPKPFKIVLALLFSINSIGLYLYRPTLEAVYAYLLLHVFVWASYRWFSPARYPLTGTHLVLLKYPAFLLMLTGPVSIRHTRPLIAALLVYLCFASHELLDDPRLASMPSTGRVLVAQSLLLALASGALLIDGVADFPPALLILILAVLFMALFKGLRRPAVGPWSYGAFAVGMLNLAAVLLVRS